MKKKGVTIVSVSIIILVLLILVSVISISASRAIKMSKLRVFATEISMVQDELNDYLNTSSLDCTYGYIKLKLENVNASVISSQFDEETITDNELSLIELDLSKLGINNTQYGNKNDATDIYAVSEQTLRVYYIKGYSTGDKVYYTYHGDLEEMFDITASNESKNIVTFTPNTIKMTNTPISVIVKIPKIFSNVIINATESVDVATTSVEKDNHFEYTVNTNNLPTNYIITVNYNDDLNNPKQIQYEVKNFDNIVPVISEISEANIRLNESTSINEAYIYDIAITDNNIIKKQKYDDITISLENAKNYFNEEGISFTGNVVKLISKSNEYTIYAEDAAGNYAIRTITIPDEITDKIEVQGILNYTRTYDLKNTGYSYNNPPIPAGFKAIDVSDTALNPTPTKWKDRALDYNKGLVIEDSIGNQFVWVPVENKSDYDYLYASLAIVNGVSEAEIRATYSDHIKTDSMPDKINNEIDQINIYGGFYVSRFEIGAVDKIADIIYNDGSTYTGDEANTFGRILSKKGSTVWTNIDYSYAKQNSENYINNDYVCSGLMTLLQQNAIAKWISNTTIPNENEKYNVVTGKNYGNLSDSESPADIPEHGTIQVSGFSEYFKANNIYDILGNVFEWTNTTYIDGEDTSYIVVGSCFNSTDASLLNTETVTNNISNLVGYRIVLYIK